jgi:hypothetical protein
MIIRIRTQRRLITDDFWVTSLQDKTSIYFRNYEPFRVRRMIFQEPFYNSGIAETQYDALMACIENGTAPIIRFFKSGVKLYAMQSARKQAKD